jgi:hypothetical protein
VLRRASPHRRGLARNFGRTFQVGARAGVAQQEARMVATRAQGARDRHEGRYVAGSGAQFPGEGYVRNAAKVPEKTKPAKRRA